MFTEIPRERRVSFAAAAMFEYSDSSTPVASIKLDIGTGSQEQNVILRYMYVREINTCRSN